MLVGNTSVSQETRTLWMVATVALLIAIMLAPVAIAVQIDGLLGFPVGLSLACGVAAIRSALTKPQK